MLVIWGASLIVFLAFHVVADPVRTMLPLGTPETTIDRVREDLGLNDPMVTQYVHFLDDVVHGDFGESLWLRQPAFAAALARVPVTAFLVVSATLIGAIVGTTLGIIASLKPGSIADLIVNVFTYLMVSLPHYWLAILFVMFFSLQLGILPTSGYGPDIRFAVLPVMTLSLIPLGRTAQLVRASMIDESQKQYVTMARGKGMSPVRAAARHQLRNVALPLLTLLFYDLGHLFVGESVIVETIFAWPGIGRLAVGALNRGDVFLAQAIVVIAAFVIASSNLVADLLALRMDPRVRDSLRRK